MEFNKDIKDDILIPFSRMDCPEGVSVRLFQEKDFLAIQKLYEKEGWLTIIKRPQEGLKAWLNSDPVLIASHDEDIVGVIRGLTDGEITTYIVELIINKDFRGKGIGKCLIEACHLLYPRTRIEVLATETSRQFYKCYGFRDFFGLRKSYY